MLLIKTFEKFFEKKIALEAGDWQKTKSPATKANNFFLKTF